MKPIVIAKVGAEKAGWINPKLTLPILLIAEAGVNHNGSLDTARQLIDVAAAAGADYVKFQTFTAGRLVSRKARKAAYQLANTGSEEESQYRMLQKLELSAADHRELMRYCEAQNIRFLSTAFDVEGLHFLDSLGLELFKCPSGEITNYPYLKALARLGKPVILSTGMADMQEIETALDVLTSEGLSKEEITVLHCNTEYPTPMEDVNLKAMGTIRDTLGVQTGYSDHTLGIEVPVAAAALGARVIEKHFTLSRKMDGPDHRASLEPGELRAMVRAVRNVEKALSGHGRKEPSKSELPNRKIARKSLHLARPVKKGAALTEEDLLPLRPGDGISPMEWKQVIGKTVTADFGQYHQLRWEDLH